MNFSLIVVILIIFGILLFSQWQTGIINPKENESKTPLETMPSLPGENKTTELQPI